MKKIILGLLVIGLTSQVFSQVIPLPEIEITAANYKYISTIDSKDLDIDVKMLQEKIADFDLKNADFYLDEYHTYEVIYHTYEVEFYIPNGTILVAYDKNGEILRTIERYNDVKLPAAVKNTITTYYPEWTLKKDVYQVTYNQNISKKVYKVILEKEGKVLRLKIDDKGMFIGNIPSTENL